MKKLYQAVDRFCARNPRFGIPNLMRVIAIGTVVVYLLEMFAGYEAISFLALNLEGLKRFELWRLVTFIFMPNDLSPLWLAISLYLYHWIGSTLEREWGTAKFSVFYFSGVALNILYGMAVGGSGSSISFSKAR